MKYKIGLKAKNKKTKFKGVITDYWETETDKQYRLLSDKGYQWVLEKNIKLK